MSGAFFPPEKFMFRSYHKDGCMSIEVEFMILSLGKRQFYEVLIM